MCIVYSCIFLHEGWSPSSIFLNKDILLDKQKLGVYYQKILCKKLWGIIFGTTKIMKVIKGQVAKWCRETPTVGLQNTALANRQVFNYSSHEHFL